LRDVSREITSFGLEFYLQGKLLGAVGEFFEYAQQQIPKFAETLLQDERALLSTAEGMSVHIADEAIRSAQAEQMLLQNMDKTGKNAGRNIANKEIHQSSSSSSSKLATETSKYSFKHGVYEDASYHTTKSNPIKSARPTNGQHALDNSFHIKDTSPSRIAVSNDEFVVLMQHKPGHFHGHVRTWNQLEDKMKSILQKAGIVTA